MIAQGTPAELMRSETLEQIYGIPMGILPHPAGAATCEFCVLMRDLYPLTRRRLLTAMALSPLLWQMNTAQAAAIDPRRIVALEWLPVELLLALGITPYGVADVPNYKLWVSEPPLPDSVIDVGLRTEPNLELLTEMKPSFMVWSAGYGPSPEKLARIAPGRGFDFSDGKKPLAVARRSLVELAQTLNLEAAAEKHLAQYDRFIASLKPRFIRRGGRPLLMTTLIDPRHMLVLGPNCLFQEVLDEYGIRNAWQGGNQLLGQYGGPASIGWRCIKRRM
ncbi:ferrichrome-binding periplasmic protein [Salmonella enterica subsp. arizonae]|uniref:Ferrichrome-binding periplasmic protein n=1 Tax=Salmonella enterica subsp. arizonae TaxID=59203 RepID=A0A379SB90_SALER|nr:ferrichrome-binding periplasmic protein [Salmonella enterica subsp. arizonae]